ncbi:hypothetical protein [Virgisporangium aurantiacum]|uniref:RHS repeat protein n=1 Tax=Virgisporangium aurantiacum TaxID=175570 RepID=A0A8J4E6L4_9ACTN|nr:hypothetical protein [Virgisporangium aurantiacum]GIJ63551.1 hypothetical protein Vau01_110670 [Virgisporangium aurantiacum]
MCCQVKCQREAAYISATAYDTLGRVDTLTLGAGTKRVQLRTRMDPATGRLAENRVSLESQTTPGTFVPQIPENYSYDPAGNVTAIREDDGGGNLVSNQCFAYDRLRQLTEAWTTTASATCQTTPTQAGRGVPRILGRMFCLRGSDLCLRSVAGWRTSS